MFKSLTLSLLKKVQNILLAKKTLYQISNFANNNLLNTVRNEQNKNKKFWTYQRGLWL